MKISQQYYQNNLNSKMLFLKTYTSARWRRYMPLILALWKQKQADIWVQSQNDLQNEFQDSQGYTETLSLYWALNQIQKRKMSIYLLSTSWFWKTSLITFFLKYFQIVIWIK